MSRRTHGMANTVEYHTWTNIRARCYYPRDKNYGGRGVTVCDRWLSSFENFITDMGRRPPGRYSIERLDNSKGYEPGNCIWLPTEKQNAHRGDAVFITVGDRTLRFADWAAETGISEATLRSRYKYGIVGAEFLAPSGALLARGAAKSGQARRGRGQRPTCNAGAAALFDIIVARGLSQKEASLAMGISLAGLRLWFTGKSVPYLRVAARIEEWSGGKVAVQLWTLPAQERAA